MKKKIFKLIISALLMVLLFPGAALISNAGGYEGDDISGYTKETDEYYSHYYKEGMSEVEKTYWQWDWDMEEDGNTSYSVDIFKNTKTGAQLKNGWYRVDGEDVYFDENGWARRQFINGRESHEGGWELGYKNVYKTDPTNEPDWNWDWSKVEKVKYDWIKDSKGYRYGATGYFYSDDSDSPGMTKGTYYLKGEVGYFKDGKDWNTCIIDGKTYIFDADGYIVTDKWFNDGDRKLDDDWPDSWMYATSDGTLATGWTEINGNWYYFNTRNIMQTSTTKDGYYIDKDGTCITTEGWVYDWYWINKSKNEWGEIWRYINSDGKITIGWAEINGLWYYFDKNGTMYKSSTVDGYYLTKDGTLSTGGWERSWYWTDYDKGEWKYVWIYSNSDGSVPNGWTDLDGTWYYFFKGEMASDEYVDGYYINSDGMYDETNTAAWYQDGNGWYYMDSNNWCPTNTKYRIDGTTYKFDENGYIIQG